MSDVDEPITIATPDHEWPRLYEDERARVRAALGVAVSSIEPFGSTAVPGLIGKPIIDILVGVSDLQAAKALTPSLVALGYEDFGEIFVAGRVYLRKRDVVPGFNLAITEVGGAFWNASLAVRDYLRAHPSEVDAYAQHKRDAVARGATLFSSYSRDKEPFVAGLRDRALAWTAALTQPL